MRTRPSTIYGVRPAYVAFCFDRAVETFGRSCEDAVRSKGEGQKDQKAAERAARRELDRWLASVDTVEERMATPGRFQDPFAKIDVTTVIG